MNKEVERLIAQVQTHKYRYLIFDLDETLTHLKLPWDEWEKRMLAQLPPTASIQARDMLRHQTSNWGVVINALAKDNNAVHQKIIDISRTFEAEYFSHAPYHALIEALSTLQQDGRTFFLWTSNSRATAGQALRELGILERFSKIISHESVLQIKPDKDGWSQLHDQAQPLDAYLFIGDSSNDEQAARSIGIDFFKITYFKQTKK